MNTYFKNIAWKEFVIQDLFDIKIGKNVDGNKVNKYSGKTAYVTRKETQNGIDGFINFDSKYINSNKPVITIGNETAQPFVQNYPFFTGTKVNILSPKKDISKHALFFICRSLEQHKSKYSYSFTINSTRLKRQKILLPANAQGNPDYAFMEAYIQQKERNKLEGYQDYIGKRLKKLRNVKKVKPLQEKEWNEFFLNEIFPDLKRGKRLKKADHKSGMVPYVSSTASNNGVDGYIGNQKNVRIFNDCLSVANSGSVGACFYQPYNFIASDHVTKLKDLKLTRYSYQFISVLVSRVGEKYSYNREISDKRMRREKIMLPITDTNQPDYAYMENYMKCLEYQKLKHYQEKKEFKNSDNEHL